MEGKSLNLRISPTFWGAFQKAWKSAVSISGGENHLDRQCCQCCHSTSALHPPAPVHWVKHTLRCSLGLRDAYVTWGISWLFLVYPHLCFFFWPSDTVQAVFYPYCQARKFSNCFNDSFLTAFVTMTPALSFLQELVEFGICWKIRSLSWNSNGTVQFLGSLVSSRQAPHTGSFLVTWKW